MGFSGLNNIPGNILLLCVYKRMPKDAIMQYVDNDLQVYAQEFRDVKTIMNLSYLQIMNEVEG